MVIKGVIFDLGGVVVRDILEEDNGLMADWFGVPVADFVRARRNNWADYELGKISGVEFFSRIALDLGVEVDASELFERTFELIKRDEQVVGLIRLLRQKGFKTGILSNNTKEWSRFELKDLKLGELVDVAVFSCDYDLRKPDKRIYDLVLEQLSLKPKECVFIDDKKRNIDAALSFGWNAVLFQGLADLKQKLLDLGIRLHEH